MHPTQVGAHLRNAIRQASRLVDVDFAYTRRAAAIAILRSSGFTLGEVGELFDLSKAGVLKTSRRRQESSGIF